MILFLLSAFLLSPVSYSFPSFSAQGFYFLFDPVFQCIEFVIYESILSPGCLSIVVKRLRIFALFSFLPNSKTNDAHKNCQLPATRMTSLAVPTQNLFTYNNLIIFNNNTNMASSEYFLMKETLLILLTSTRSEFRL